ncbi:MAG: hypothetical protein RSC49_03490 [Clostridium sp.]
MENKLVTVGEKANIFHDQTTGITVCKGEIVELSPRQLLSKRVRVALNSGHLVYTTRPMEEEKSKMDKDATVKLLTSKYEALHNSGKDSSKISQAFTLDELKMIAEGYSLEVEDDDTKATISEAICAELDEKK